MLAFTTVLATLSLAPSLQRHAQLSSPRTCVFAKLSDDHDRKPRSWSLSVGGLVAERPGRPYETQETQSRRAYYEEVRSASERRILREARRSQAYGMNGQVVSTSPVASRTDARAVEYARMEAERSAAEATARLAEERRLEMERVSAMERMAAAERVSAAESAAAARFEAERRSEEERRGAERQAAEAARFEAQRMEAQQAAMAAEAAAAAQAAARTAPSAASTGGLQAACVMDQLSQTQLMHLCIHGSGQDSKNAEDEMSRRAGDYNVQAGLPLTSDGVQELTTAGMPL